MTKEQAMVLEFTKEFKLFYVEQLTIPTKEIADLRIAFLREESKELKEAYDAQDLIEVADALGDFLYVTYGTALACGTEPTPLRKAFLIHRDPPILMSPEQFTQRSLRLTQTIDMLEREFERGRAFEAQISTVWQDWSRSRIAAIIEVLVWATYITADMFNLDLAPIFAEIHRSNMTKKGGIISSTGKLCKPNHYEPPNLQPIIAAMGK